MSEYSYVEKLFLDQLAALGWQVIDQGNVIPDQYFRFAINVQNWII